MDVVECVWLFQLDANSRLRMIESLSKAEVAIRRVRDVCSMQTAECISLAAPLPLNLARQVHTIFDRVVFIGSILKL
jgi:hypothetical protein